MVVSAPKRLSPPWRYGTKVQYRTRIKLAYKTLAEILLDRKQMSTSELPGDTNKRWSVKDALLPILCVVTLIFLSSFL